MKKSLSLVVITLNEEKNIERCLKSVPFASEIIVVDSGSQDRTQEIAKSFGAKVFTEKFRGFGAQKNFAAQHTSNDWILSLDADEALSPELAEQIQHVLNSPEEQEDAYSMPRLSFHMGRWIRHGGWYPDRQIRLYNKSRAKWDSQPVHEKIIAARVSKLPGALHHWVFRDLHHQIETNNRYSGLGADRLVEEGWPFSLMKLLFKPWSKFLETYILKRGFLDGMPGFIIAVGAAYSVFLKYAKLWELRRIKKAQKTVSNSSSH